MSKKKNPKVGSVLIAKRQYRMSKSCGGAIFALNGKRYRVKEVSDTELTIDSEAGQGHYFDLDPTDESYWGKYFTLA